ncbi:hypothetical protein K438DRAFT_1717825 [Mycena galopus ATCC 62051]|nr:hypothetical protein K438DRAFT_1717825 [Mycena galopus ATCC 62051]
MTHSRSPPPKRVKLESPPPAFIKSEPDAPQDERQLDPEELEELEDEEEDEERCSICLQEVVDRTVVPVCSHEFCFDCLLVWTKQSRRCPLCSQGIGPFLIHRMRSRYDYQKHYLNPLPTSPRPVPPQPLPLRQNRAPRRRQRERQWGRRERAESDETDRLDRSIAKRRWIYEHDLYAKHVASNAFTRYRPYPTPAQFAASPDLISRTTMFLRRELQVWVNLDVEFLQNFIISIMKAIDIRSESAVKLLSEFLDLDAPYVEGGRHVNAEHFAHEIYSYVRSPYKDLFVYDSVVQYEVTPEVPPPAEEPRRRWREASRSRSPAGSARDVRDEGTSRIYEEPHPVRSHSRSLSSSPSSRRRTSSRDRELNEHTSRGSGRRQRNPSRPRETNEHFNAGDNFDIGAGETDAHIRYNQPECLLPPPNAATEITETLNSKGKARGNSSEVSIPEVLPDESPIVPPASVASRKPPRLRNRSLFESVQAHLAVPSRKQRETKPLLDSTLSSSKRSAALDTGSVPSLLTRLSDPSTLEPIYKPQLPPHVGGDATAIDDPASEIFDLRSVSAPEIMGRSRARLAKLAANASPSLSPKYLPLNGSASTASSAPLSLDGNRDSPENIEDAVESESTTRRARLLDRLHEEKQKAGGGGQPPGVAPAELALNVSLDDRISQSHDTLGGDLSRGAVENVDAAEARLRRQAQLRVRLAAEKRKHPSWKQ